MAEVEPEDILVIDQGRREAKFADSLPAVQRVIDQIGGVHNLNLGRLSTSKKCLLVEGKDLEILKQFQNNLIPNSSEPLRHNAKHVHRRLGWLELRDRIKDVPNKCSRRGNFCLLSFGFGLPHCGSYRGTIRGSTASGGFDCISGNEKKSRIIFSFRVR